MAEFPDPDSRNVLEPDCSRCPALVESRESIAWGNGSLDADVLVVGEAPASGTPDAERWRGGNWTGMAYTSRHSGRTVRDLFADAGLASEDCYFTNAVKCFPAEDHGGDDGESDEIPTNREPTADERANCRDHLRTEIRQVEPAVVATTGRHATLSLLGDLPGGFLDSVLEPVESEAFDATVLPLLHPSYQNVWLPRLGYSREEYVAEIGAVVGERRERDG
ncbi:uracil-DNA glycosylase [Halorussus gelatinilyticus]|uniref:Uracil-DNA glycosylase n=1 Tax=Halorussus gelatinilyticus TaxID=2937524 RepID=A0A8U0IM50_9EURY|nr:uracil-DNA glycosylase family protein [Halorussus gelatinilyticus]UPW02210.1 uracil-DNA glycosylase [Halorussus gelatinilyticus]